MWCFIIIAQCVIYLYHRNCADRTTKVSYELKCRKFTASRSVESRTLILTIISYLLPQDKPSRSQETAAYHSHLQFTVSTHTQRRQSMEFGLQSLLHFCLGSCLLQDLQLLMQYFPLVLQAKMWPIQFQSHPDLCSLINSNRDHSIWVGL